MEKDYLVDNGNNLRFRNIEIKHFRKLAVYILKYVAYNIGPTSQCSIANDIF